MQSNNLLISLPLFQALLVGVALSFLFMGMRTAPIPISSSPLCHPDFAALVALYNATGGAMWSDNTGWIDGAAGTDCTPCGWYGVTCNGMGRVTELDLNLNNLTGTLPMEIGDLSELEDINFTSNQIAGMLPMELGSLSNLIQLGLARNQFSGTIPMELGNLGNLETLSLEENLLSGSIPVELGNLSDLLGLTLSNNQLTGTIPIELGMLSNLLGMNLSVNQLTGSIPTEIGNLTNLLVFNLSYNQLSGSIPGSLGNLLFVGSLHLNNNLLTGCFPSPLMNICPDPFDIVDMSNNVGLPGGGDFAAFCLNGTGACALALDLSVLLGGPYDTGNLLMNDHLRQANIIPLMVGGSTISDPNLLNVTGQNAIVDWVTIEFRPMAMPSTIQFQQAALVQRDGDVVDVQGLSPIYIGGSLPAGNYHVAIRHRNHLGVMHSATVTVN